MKKEIMEMLEKRLKEAKKYYDLMGSSEAYASVHEIEEIIYEVEKMEEKS